MSHFTYKTPETEELKQGDILCKNNDIYSILEEVHPHYLKPDYQYFIVLTQTCDLVMRNQKCKAPYITLAAVRPLELLLKRIINNYQVDNFEVVGEICNTENKYIVTNFLQRLFNNNEPEYFFLCDDESLGFPNKMVAFLRLSISIKTDLHYQSCINAKILELNETFRAKLGWLVGQMYSRVGTQDWVPSTKTKKDFDNMLNSILNQNILWVEKKVLKKMKSEYKNQLDSFSIEKIREIVKSIKIREDRDVILDRILHIIDATGLIPEKKDILKIVHRIGNDPVIDHKIK